MTNPSTEERAETSRNRQATAEDRESLKSSLLFLGKPDYEKIRAKLIGKLGYDQFRELQSELFKEIVAENPANV